MSYKLPAGDERPSEMVELLPAEIMALKNMGQFLDYMKLLYKEHPPPLDKDGKDSFLGWKDELLEGLETLFKAGERLSNSDLHVRNHNES